MGRIINLVNKKFGRLSVLYFSHKDRRHKAHWMCKCTCGNTKVVAGASLRRGYAVSCGCFRIEEIRSDLRRKMVSENNKKVGKWVGKSNPGYGKKGNNNPAFKKEVKFKISLSKMGSKNPSWAGGIASDIYCPIFRDKSFKSVVLHRDHYTCQNCGITRMLSFKVLDKNLDIHHINYNKKDCDLNNLITLCQRCNTKANNNRDLWEGFYRNRIIAMNG